MLDRWCTSLKVDSWEKLREIVLEEFRSSVSQDIQTYLNEREITELRAAAIAADEYTLTHKSKYGQNGRFDNRKSDYRSLESPHVNNVGSVSSQVFTGSSH